MMTPPPPGVSPPSRPAFPAGPRASAGDFLRVMRPRQWTKNLVVLAAFFFALGDRQQPFDHARGACWALLAAALFCAVSSAVYVFNDIMDRDRDREHPVKRHRPIAAGRIAPAPAAGLAAILATGGLACAWLVSPGFALSLVAYVLLQAAYTLWLKHVALVDVFVIAAGFVLRAVAGGLAVHVIISNWLLICTFLMALFLALCKRRHEKRLADDTRLFALRPSLAESDERLFDQLIAISAGAAIVAYAIYTQSPDTVSKFGTSHLSWTLPFVIFGIFRYLDLVYRQAKGDQPEYILLTDVPLIVDILFFGLSVLWVFIAA